MKAVMRVQTDRKLGPVSPYLRGYFLEMHARCIYGGIYEEGSPLSDSEGMRRDVLEAIRELKPSVIRWPGGNFSTDYDWRDGVRPLSERPYRTAYGTGLETDLRFGTHEFLDWCRKTGAEPMLTVNGGNGSTTLAADWVEYCNGTGRGQYAELRRANGFPEPWKVPHWCLGNELYGDWIVGTKTGEEYGRWAAEAGRLMRLQDPTIKLMGMSTGIFDPAWDRESIRWTAALVDYISLHIYLGRHSYYDCVGSPVIIQKGIDAVWSAIEEIGNQLDLPKLPQIALDEYNVWYRSRLEINNLEEHFNLQDALTIASLHHVLLRNPHKVGMACISFPANTLGVVMTSPEGMYRQTIYWPLHMLAHACAGDAVDCFVNSPTFNCRHPRMFAGFTPLDEEGKEAHTENQLRLMKDYEGLPYLDAAATFDETSGQLSLSVVNRHETEAIECSVQVLGQALRGQCRGRLLTSKGVKDANDFAEPDRVHPVDLPVAAAANEWVHTFPAHSHTVLTVG